jgi:hypothetical protein
MDDQFKERISAALMGDLLVALAKHEKIRRMLGEMDGWSADEVVKQLLDAFETIVEQKLREARAAAESKKPGTESDLPTDASGIPAPLIGGTVLSSFSELFSHLGPTSISLSDISFPDPLPSPTVPAVEQPAPTASVAPPPEPPAPPPPPVEEAAGTTIVDLPDVDSLIPAPEEKPEPAQPTEEAPSPPAPKPVHKHPPYEFAEDDVVYVHAVGGIPADETPATRPFMLEEKGIEDKDFAFALDHRGLRIYLSKVHARAATISKSGILLMNKAESITLRGRHEAILNELRGHGMLLPFEFGTVARGKDELLEKVDSHLSDLHLAVEDMAGTSWWDVSVFTLDARFAQMVAIEASPRHQRERSRPSFASQSTTGKVDIKTLERILGKQKKIAEAIRDELSAVADRSDVDMIITLGGGTSEDWKLILKASFEVAPERYPAFIRTVTDIQYRHFTADIMLAVSGEHDPFSFQD